MTDTSIGASPDGDDSPLSWKIFCFACIPILAAVFIFGSNNSETNVGINQFAAWIEANPTSCVEECSFGNFIAKRIGGDGVHVFVLSKNNRSVGSFVNGELFIRSDVDDAGRHRLRSEIALSAPAI